MNIVLFQLVMSFKIDKMLLFYLKDDNSALKILHWKNESTYDGISTMIKYIQYLVVVLIKGTI